MFAQRIVDHFELVEFFHAVYGSELDGTNADKADLIAHVLRVDSLSSSETIMIGDRAHDVVGAKMNGIVPIGALWGYGSLEELIAAGVQILCDKPGALVEAVSVVNGANQTVSSLPSGRE